jgi:hypothetical protein
VERKKYPGQLGRPIPLRDAAAAALLHYKDGNGFLDWHWDRNIELMPQLLEHYGIELTDERRWLKLAFFLAREHVPGFTISSTRGRGRPRKTVTLAELLTQDIPAKRRPGRRKEYTDQFYRGYLNKVRQVCQEKGYSGRGAISAAISHLIEQASRAHGEATPTRSIARLLPFWRKQYSVAKKKFPELAV